MRLYDLGLLFDRDGYDEGVYWQTLRAMSAGHTLYQQIFYSQPPFFLLSLYPGFALFGCTLWSARLGIALISLLGLLGALLLGKVLAGRLGAIVALLLLIADPLYLAQSQTIQAEAPSVALSLLAVGLAYMWWEHPEGVRGLCWAALTGIALSLSILSKLFVSALVPVGLLMLARIWQIWQRQSGTNRTSLRPIFVGVAACLMTMLVVLLPFVGSSQKLFQDVITFHIQAGAVIGRAENTKLLRHFLFSALGLTALYGTFAACLRRDWRVVPLLAWFLITAFLLWRLSPLFPHHLVELTPTLIALSVMGIGKPPIQPIPFFQGRLPVLAKCITPLALLLVLATTALEAQQDVGYYQTATVRSGDALAHLEVHVVADLQQAITPDQLVVTDAQFIADLADRNTPPSLVDTSMVGIVSGYVTAQELIDAASEPQVHAVLFFSGRFHLRPVGAFYGWVRQHFRRIHTYWPGQELWVR